jgi:hypothetical protein
MSTSDISALIERLETLEQEEAELSRRRIALHQRMAIFPSEGNDREERGLSERRVALHREIDIVQIELATARLAVRRDSHAPTS